MSKVNKSFYRDCVAALLIILLFVSPIAFGAEPASGGDEQRILTTAEQQLQERVTFTCRNLPIDTVLMQLADQAKVDIIKSPKVQGNVTVKVTDVPLDEALNNILAAHNWTYIASENMIRVMPFDERKTQQEQEIVEPYIRQITYADVKEVALAVKGFISSKGKVAYDKGTSHIMVSDRPSRIKAIDRFIAQIDRETPQVMVEARIYDVSSSDIFDIGMEWTAGRNTPLTTIEHKNTLKRTDEHDSAIDTWEHSVTTLTDTTVDPPIDGIIDDLEETTAPETTGWGIDEEDIVETEDTSWWVDEEGELIPYRKSKPFIGGTFTEKAGGTLRFGLLNNMIDLDIRLKMLEKEVEAKLLANPRVLVLDNETATFKIVREIPYTESLQAIGGAGGLVATVRFKDVGVQLQVTPHIARNGMIRLKLIPEFGVQVGETTFLVGGSAAGAPQVDTRKLETVALVKDGQTVVMGGLRKQETRKTLSKVRPFWETYSDMRPNRKQSTNYSYL
jgi:type IV pilus assembly protein PilQ